MRVHDKLLQKRMDGPTDSELALHNGGAKQERFHTTCSDSPTCFLLIIFKNKHTSYPVVRRLSSLWDIA